MKGFEDGLTHGFAWGGFAGPEFELGCALGEEHFYSVEDWDALTFCEDDEWSLERVVDEIEEELAAA